MKKNTLYVIIMMVMLFMAVLTRMINIQPVMAGGTIYIRADGSIDPPTAPIERVGSYYMLTDKIEGSTIVIEKDDIIIDGRGYVLKGPGSFILLGGSDVGIYLEGRDNVTVKNMEIREFDYGIYLFGSSGNNIFRNHLVNNSASVVIGASPYNNITYNFIAESEISITLGDGADDNSITNNVIKDNSLGVFIVAVLYDTKYNVIYHNDFINNTRQTDFAIELKDATNYWDNGSVGNYWSDYTGEDANMDGIGDTPYIIYENNTDHYPKMKPVNLGTLASELARKLIGAKYCHGKGWNWTVTVDDSKIVKATRKGGRFLTPDEIKNGYYFVWCEKKNEKSVEHREKGYGLDCAGLVYWSYNKAWGAKYYSPYDKNSYLSTIGYEYPGHVLYFNPIVFEGAHNLWAYNTFLGRNISWSLLSPGDVLFFDSIRHGRQDGIIDHVAMYVGDYYYSGGKIGDYYYPAGVYNCIESGRYGRYNGVVPRTLAKKTFKYQEKGKIKTYEDKGLANYKSFVGFGIVDYPVVLDGDTYCKVMSKSPVDLNITNPDGYVVTHDFCNGGDMQYLECDINGDGELDDIVLIPGQEIGDYLIHVIPEPGADPNDTYTLELFSDNQTTILADNVLVSEIPSSPYVVTSTGAAMIPRNDPHDVGITQFTSPKTIVGQNSTLHINMTLFNYGQFTENFNVTLSVQPQANITNINEGLVAYWKFDEGNGTTSYDSSGNGNNGTLMNGPTWVDGKVSKALSFDGVDDFVEADDSSSLKIDRNITITAWIYSNLTDDGIDHFIIAKGRNTDETGGYQVAVSQWNNRVDALGFAVQTTQGNKWIFLNNSIPNNEWTYIAAVYDGYSMKLYINGVLALNESHSGDIVVNNYSLTIGARKDTSEQLQPSWWKGIIDEVKIYDRALSADEIWAEYNRTIPTRHTYSDTECNFGSWHINSALFHMEHHRLRKGQLHDKRLRNTSSRRNRHMG